MNRILPSIPADLLPTILEVLDACPVDHCNPTDCPLFALRSLPRRKRVLWLNALSEDDLRYLAAYHKVCMGLKLAAHPPASKPETQSGSSKRQLPGIQRSGL
jgi:hypothetical protein